MNKPSALLLGALVSVTFSSACGPKPKPDQTSTIVVSSEWRTDCKRPAASQPTKSGKVRVMSEVPARIYVDGCSTGVSTPATIKLPVGLHLIGLILDSGDRVTHRTKIKDGKVIMLNMRGRP